MGPAMLHATSPDVRELQRKQHGVVERSQLRSLGFSEEAIRHGIESGRLHALWRGVYAVGRPEVTLRGRWMAAVLSCGDSALLSHRCAGAHWGLIRSAPGIEVVVPYDVVRRRPGIRVRRRRGLDARHRRVIDGIPVTDPVSTLVDLASCMATQHLERAINEADRLDLVDPETLAGALGSLPRRRPGVARLGRLLARQTFTDSGLERRFLALARSAGLPTPETQAWINGYRVDFYWPWLGLVVETDGLRYHRTPGQQAKDQHRDQAHVMAGLTALRFPEAQIRYEPRRVQATLAAVATRLRAAAPPAL